MGTFARLLMEEKSQLEQVRKPEGYLKKSETSKKLSKADPQKLTQCCTPGNFHGKIDHRAGKEKTHKHCHLHVNNVLNPIAKMF